MTPAIPPELIPLMNQLFARDHRIWSVRLFGSRADGHSQPGSDIDLAIEGPLPAAELSRIRLDIDELPTLCRFDIIHLDSPINPDLKSLILRDGIVIYSR